MDLAKLIDIKRSQLNEIIKGKRNINAVLALLLEKALGIDADFWMEAQKNYDLDSARIEAKNKEQLEAIEIWNVDKVFIPVSFYRKEQVISGNPVIDNQKIREIYRVANLEQLTTMRCKAISTGLKNRLRSKPFWLTLWAGYTVAVQSFGGDSLYFQSRKPETTNS
jgi:HTH-type transcriptional regulator/antitoxin HigA